MARRIAAARALRVRLDRAIADGAAAPSELQGEVNRYSVSTVCDKRELFWPRHWFNFRPLGVARLAARLWRPAGWTAPRAALPR